MELLLRNDYGKTIIDEDKLLKRTRNVLKLLNCNEAELSVLLCGDEDIRKIHKEYLGKDCATNVISFSQTEGEFGNMEPEMLGDVVISVDTAARDAREVGKNVDDEVLYLLIHGILHLLGFDHEGDNSHLAPIMEEKEEELFRLAIDET